MNHRQVQYVPALFMHMTLEDITQLRLVNQRIVGKKCEKPAEVVRWMGAMQAQDYQGALWAVGLRTNNATVTAVEQAIAAKEIVRTWPMRGTLHFIPAEDIRWMLKLMTPKVITSAASRHRNLGLDEAIFTKSRKLFEKALHGGKILTRNKMYEVLIDGGISLEGQRGIHILWTLAQQGLLCFGPHEGKQPTFTLLDEWLPDVKDLDREEALAKLTRTYFLSHGPATVQDFSWWTGLKQSDARVGIELAKSDLRHEIIESKEYWMGKNLTDIQLESPIVSLLPSFEEYMLGYRDRSAALQLEHSNKVAPGGNGIFFPIIVIDGQVVGTWKKAVRKNGITITLNPFTSFSKAEITPLEREVVRYGEFLGVPATLL